MSVNLSETVTSMVIGPNLFSISNKLYVPFPLTNVLSLKGNILQLIENETVISRGVATSIFTK